MLIGAIILIIVLIIASIIVLVWPYFKKIRARKDFFNRAYKVVYNIARDKDYYLINDVELLIDTKPIHFDHILFGEKYIYCIGNNFRDGAISGNYSDAKWFLYPNSGKTEYVNNPLLLHNTRVEYLKSAIKADDILIGIYVCNDDCLINEVKDNPENVLILNQKELKEYILKKEKSNIPPINSIQLDQLVRLIYNMSQRAKNSRN